MTTPDLQLSHCDRLVVGLRGNRQVQLEAIALCRRFDGCILLREGDVMVVEIVADPEVSDDLMTRLSRLGVTHIWQTSGTTPKPGAPAGSRNEFCGILS